MNNEIKTIKIDGFGYELLKMVQTMLDDVNPGQTTMGTAATFGAFFALNELAKFKAKLSKTPKGQLYLALVKILKEQK